MVARSKGRYSINYSNRSASVGFTAEARWAGMSAAPGAVEHRTKVAARIVTGSVGLTSYSCDSIRRPNAQTNGSANRCSRGDDQQRIAEDQQTVERRVAPSANRIPISR